MGCVCEKTCVAQKGGDPGRAPSEGLNLAGEDSVVGELPFLSPRILFSRSFVTCGQKPDTVYSFSRSVTDLNRV